MGRDKDHMDRIIGKLRTLWYTFPDLRLTQLLMNVLNMEDDPYYVEDDELERKLDDYAKKMWEKKQS